MIKRNLTSKITAAITSSAMLLSYCNLSAFANSDLTSSVFSYENYDITYSFTNHWSDKYQGSIFVKNTSEETIHDWCLAFVSDTSYDEHNMDQDEFDTQIYEFEDFVFSYDPTSQKVEVL